MKTIFVRALVIVSILSSIQTQAWTTSQDAADRLGATQMKELSFQKNSSNLTEAQKTELRKVINEAAQKGQIDEVKILVWSDKEYPNKNMKQSKSDIKLAKNRLNDLKSFLKKDLNVSTVDSYNMTERPNALQKFFNTSDAKVKNTTELVGAAPTDMNTGLFDMNAQASKGVVMIFMKK